MNATIGIDIGGSSIKMAVVSSEGSIVSQRRISTTPSLSAPELLGQVRSALDGMMSGVHEPYPTCCGIGIPGVVQQAAGVVEYSGPLNWRNVPLRDLAEQILGYRVRIDTDVNAGALADLNFGVARHAADVLYVSWGSGIGAGLAFARQMYHTRGGAMCNLGHMLAKLDSTRFCYCGIYGCLEIEAGGRAIVQKMSERKDAFATQGITPATVADAAANGDVDAREILEEAAALMARVIAGTLALLNPDMVVFGGGVSAALPLVREAFDRELALRCPQFSLPLTRFEYSAFGESAGVVGAAALARMEVAS